MDLKKELEERLTEEISDLKERLSIREDSLNILKGLDLRRAKYKVKISSEWGDQEKSIAIRHTGSLQKAVEKAEDEYKPKNPLGGPYSISAEIRIGDDWYYIPDEFYMIFAGRE